MGSYREQTGCRHSGMVLADRLSSRQVDGLRPLLVEELVEETDVCKRPSGHDGVVPSAGAVRVEVTRVQSVDTHTLLINPVEKRALKLTLLLMNDSFICSPSAFPRLTALTLFNIAPTITSCQYHFNQPPSP